MRKPILLLTSTLVVITTATTMVYAGSGDSTNSMMRDGMMGRMSRMMTGCGAMMNGRHRNARPNEQWRNAPSRQN